MLAPPGTAMPAAAAVPAERRRDCAIYIDECQNFLNLSASLDSMLAEARKYRLSLTLYSIPLIALAPVLVSWVGVGLWTKADSITAFDDLTIRGRSA